MSDRLTFLYGSLSDMQATIRAVDVKVAALLVCLLAPLQNLHRVFKHLAHFTEWAVRWPAIVVVVLFLLTWVAAFFALVRAVAAIGNPAAHVKGAQGANSSFFLPAQFAFSRLHAVKNPKRLESRQALTDVYNNLPPDADIDQVLVFEQMKLAYIRDLKLFRLDWGLKLSLVWLLLGILIYIGSKYAITDTPKKTDPTKPSAALTSQPAVYNLGMMNYVAPGTYSNDTHLQHSNEKK